MFEKSTSDARPEQSAYQCIAGQHCVAGTTTGDTRQPAYTTDPGLLCDPCHERIQSAVKQLATDWQELHHALGEKQGSSGPAVASSRTPALPISVSKIALMSDIVEQAERAATLVAAELDIEPPTGRRNTAPTIRIPDPDTGKRREANPAENTPAWTAETVVKPDALQALRASINLVENHIDTLAAAPAQTFTVWDRAGEETDEPMRLDDDGNPVSYKGRRFEDITGLDAALTLTDTHHRVRAELGRTRLRHRYGFPCPRCGSEVGRDDGTTIVDCRNPTCKASWTEREFNFLQGLELEGREKEILKYLLAEAYSRLDGIAHVVKTLQNDEDFCRFEHVKIILDALTPHTTGHTPPADRAIATNKAATRARQLEQDGWSWRNETPYKPPKRKKAKSKPPPRQKYTDSSRSTLVDIDETIIDQLRLGQQPCQHCHCIHAGECA